MRGAKGLWELEAGQARNHLQATLGTAGEAPPPPPPGVPSAGPWPRPAPLPRAEGWPLPGSIRHRVSCDPATCTPKEACEPHWLQRVETEGEVGCDPSPGPQLGADRGWETTRPRLTRLCQAQCPCVPSPLGLPTRSWSCGQMRAR